MTTSVTRAYLVWKKWPASVDTAMMGVMWGWLVKGVLAKAGRSICASPRHVRF